MIGNIPSACDGWVQMYHNIVLVPLVTIMENRSMPRHCLFYQINTVTVIRSWKKTDCRGNLFPFGLFIIGEWAKCLVLAQTALFRNEHLCNVDMFLDHHICERLKTVRLGDGEHAWFSCCSSPGSALFMCEQSRWERSQLHTSVSLQKVCVINSFTTETLQPEARDRPSECLGCCTAVAQWSIDISRFTWTPLVSRRLILDITIPFGYLFAASSPSKVFRRPSAPTTTSNSKLARGWSAGRIAALHPSPGRWKHKQDEWEGLQCKSTKASTEQSAQLVECQLIRVAVLLKGTAAVSTSTGSATCYSRFLNLSALWRRDETLDASVQSVRTFVIKPRRWNIGCVQEVLVPADVCANSLLVESPCFHDVKGTAKCVTAEQEGQVVV